jgi:hypothetical protein
MSNTKISDLTALTGANAATTDVFPMVDVSDTTQGAGGSTKKMTRSEMFQNTPPIAVTGTLSATGITSVTDVTDATSTTAASLKTAGGLAVVKKAVFGSGISLFGSTPSASSGITLSASGNAVTAGLDININSNSAGNYGGIFNVSGAGTTNYGGYFNSSNATTNYAIKVAAGQVAIDTTTDSSSTTTGALTVAGGLAVAKKMYIGDNIVMASGKGLQTVAAYLEGSEMTAPAAPAANGFRLFAEDNGSGKTRLMVQFATGAAQQLAIEP